MQSIWWLTPRNVTVANVYPFFSSDYITEKRSVECHGFAALKFGFCKKSLQKDATLNS